MASIVWADVLAHAPELSTVASGAQADLLAHVNASIAVDDFDGEDGPNTKLARIYQAAHLATLAGFAASGASGPVASESAGGLAVSYAAALGVASYSDLSATAYGKALRGMIRRSVAGLPRVP